MASLPEWGKPRTMLLKKEQFPHCGWNSPPKGKEEWSKKEEFVSRPARTKLEAPSISSPARQPNSMSREKRKNKQNPCHPLTCPSGNQEKLICVNRSNREQQNSPACPQDTLEYGMSQRSKNSPVQGRKRCTCRKEHRTVQRREPAARKGICTEEGQSLSPDLGW